MTRMPRVSDSATFSAACRQIEQRRNSASPSFHSLEVRSKVRGVEAMVNEATAAPDGVNRSSGSAVRLPTTVMIVSPAMSALVRTQDLGAQHRLVQVQLAVELLDRGRGGLQVEDGVQALGVLLDLVGHAAPAPDVDLLDRPAGVLDDGEEGVEGRGDGALVEAGIQDHHDLVVPQAGGRRGTHVQSPPVDWSATGSPWQEAFAQAAARA